jgi:ABC-type Zn uptake system ZnuABC Zn-binding protein ZnuA
MHRLLPLLFLLAAFTPAAAQDKLKVVATIPDLSDIVRQVGGDRVDVVQLVAPGNDPHAVIAKASMVLQVSRADGLVCMGLDYEHAFLPAVLEKVRKDHLRPGGAGYMEVGERITALEVPENLDRSLAVDIHPRGNPHFNLDPRHGVVMAEAVRDLLVRIDTEHAGDYRARCTEWVEEARFRIADWEARMAPLRGKKVVTYHRSWSYFAKRYGLELAGEVEPKPGIAPSARHLAELSRRMRAEGIRVVLMEPWYNDRHVSRMTGEDVTVLRFATTVGATTATRDYFSYHEALVSAVLAAFDIADPGPAVRETGEES